jgi:uncharacterized protein YbaP (TraB family)
MKHVRLVITEVEDEEYDTLSMLSLLKMGKDDYYSFQNEDEEKLISDYISEVMKVKHFPYQSFKPMAVYSMLQVKLVANRSEDILSGGFVPIDKFFTRFAEENNIETDGFESMDEQFSLLLDSIPIQRQTEILIHFVKNRNTSEMILNQLDSCYKYLDLDCLLKNEFYGSFNTEEYNVLINNRNLRWLKVIPEKINYKPTIIAVGIGHLFGNNGLIALLRRQDMNLDPFI